MNQLTRSVQAAEAGAVALAQPCMPFSISGNDTNPTLAQRWGDRQHPAVVQAAAPVGVPAASQSPGAAGFEDSAAERGRAARELHDAISQKLFAANLLAGVLARSTDTVVSEQARVLEQLNRSALAEMRMLLFELHPQTMDSVRLPELLQQAVEGLVSRSGVEVHTDIDDSAPLPPRQRADVYRIASALLSNIARHSGANRAQLCWSAPLAGPASLRVTDNGCGFHALQWCTQSLGLARVRQRAHELNAHLVIQSAPGEGTDITLTIQRNWEKK